MDWLNTTVTVTVGEILMGLVVFAVLSVATGFIEAWRKGTK